MDRELEAVRAVLSPVPKALALLDVERREFHPDRAGAWSTGELLLVDVAEALWKGRGVPVDLGLLVNTLSREWLDAVWRGIAIYTGDPIPAINGNGEVQA